MNCFFPCEVSVEFLCDPELLAQWLQAYGAFALFALLALGIIALPIPDESLMVLAGVLMYKGSLCIPSTIAATIAGSITGITISYILGKTLGKYVIERFGGWFGISGDKVHRAHDWFDHLGRWALFFGYFIPGVRHLTGIVAGSIALEYSHFALFAYSGAIVWASTFLAIGYFFGEHWVVVFEWAELYVNEIVFVAIVAVCLYLFYRATRRK